LAETDVYLLPSLRETAGITMMEAMLAGCYPIVLAGTGAGGIVAKTGGAALKAKNPEEAISQIAEQLEWCHFHRQDMAQRAQDAAAQIRALYSKDAYQRVIRETYAEALEIHRQKLRRK
jgi:glycosyltransferase involved in cell wall biosynthesis